MSAMLKTLFSKYDVSLNRFTEKFNKFQQYHVCNMQGDSRQFNEEPYQHSRLQASPDAEYGSTFITPNPTHSISQNYRAATFSHSPAGVPMSLVGHQPGSHLTTLPPITITSGVNPMTLPPGALPPFNIAGMPYSHPMPGTNSGGVIIGPPVSHPPGMQYRSETVRNQSFDMVPRSQMQRCAQECHNWEARYKQLNNKYLNLMKEKTSSEPQDVSRLRQQNYQLEQRIIAYQASERQLSSNVDSYITTLVNKYKDSTLRETALLFDRFKLQCKTHERLQ